MLQKILGGLIRGFEGYAVIVNNRKSIWTVAYNSFSRLFEYTEMSKKTKKINDLISV